MVVLIAFCTALLSLFPPILKRTAFQLGVVVRLNLGFFCGGVVLLPLRGPRSTRAEMRTGGAPTEGAAILRLQVERLSAASMPFEGRFLVGAAHPEKPSRGKKGKKKLRRHV